MSHLCILQEMTSVEQAATSPSKSSVTEEIIDVEDSGSPQVVEQPSRDAEVEQVVQ